MKAPSSSLSSSRKPQQSYPHFLLKKTSSSKTRKIPLVFSLSSSQAVRKLLLLLQAPISLCFSHLLPKLSHSWPPLCPLSLPKITKTKAPLPKKSLKTSKENSPLKTSPRPAPKSSPFSCSWPLLL